MQPILEVEDLTVDFPSEDGVVRAVRGVSFGLQPGEVLGIVGESGSGKSVTSLAIMGLLPKTARIGGAARYAGQTDLLKLDPRSLEKIRGKKIAMIFQDPLTALNPVYTVGWQIAEAVRAHNDVSKQAAWDRAVELLDMVGIPHAKQRVKSYPHEFSGGMRQRAVIAIAMANDPDIIIADEPTTALDVTVQAQVLETLSKVQAETNSAMILITHDLGVIAGHADKVLVMYAGKPVELAGVDELYEHPRMPYTLGLLGSMPRLDATGDEPLTPIQGSPPSLINLPPGCPFSPRCPLSRAHCDEEEPELRIVAGGGHAAACHYSEELSGDVAPEEVFEVTATDISAITGDLAENGDQSGTEQIDLETVRERMRGESGGGQ